MPTSGSPIRGPDFETLAETCSAAIFIVQGNRFRYVNPALEDICGYSAAELFEMPFWDFVHPDDHEAVQERGLGRQRGEEVPTTYQFKFVTKTGGERWGEFSGTLIDFEGQSAVLGTAFDITESKLAQVALSESELRYRTLFEKNVDGIAVIVDGRIVNFNDRFAEMMGRPADELIGRSPSEFPAPEESDRVAERISAVSEGGPEFQSEYHIPRPDGSTLPVEIMSRQIQYEGGPAVLSVIRDITERVRAQEALQDAREELEGRVERQLVKRNPYSLSFRELTVLHLIATGRADKQIAAELSISPLTAQKHVSNILSKMNAASRTEASVRAVREGLLG